MNKTYMTIALMSPLVCTAAMGAKKAKANNQQKPNVIIILADRALQRIYRSPSANQRP